MTEVLPSDSVTDAAITSAVRDYARALANELLCQDRAELITHHSEHQTLLRDQLRQDVADATERLATLYAALVQEILGVER